MYSFGPVNLRRSQKAPQKLEFASDFEESERSKLSIKAVDIVVAKEKYFYVMCEPSGSLENGKLPRSRIMRWYCRCCWFNTSGRIYSYNLADASFCEVCQLPDIEAGWGHWLCEEAVPMPLVETWYRNHAPAELIILQGCWPEANLVSFKAF